MPELPLLLAGPIVRRVDIETCAFWIALSEPASVTISIWEGMHMAGGSPGTIDGGAQPNATSAATVLQKYGPHLYIGVIQFEVVPTLTPGALYSYDVVISGAMGQTGLKTLGLLKNTPATEDKPGPLALGYMENRLPSFVAQPATVNLVSFMHTSCRKSNGVGPDALAWLDDQLEITYSNMAAIEAPQRPQQLFLTGDQIYADDVGACLLPMLNTLGRDLVGEEDIFINSPTQAMESAKGVLHNFPAMRRRGLIRNNARMSSTDCDNHLITFGEFAAMYLCAWSPHVWGKLASNDELFTRVVTDSPTLTAALTNWEKCYNSTAGWKTAHEKKVDEERVQVLAWRDRVPKVARALANIATYMIFDDHEITDDWNLNKRWRNRVLRSSVGLEIIKNGMMAYTLFQGWGNDPAEFANANSKNHKLLEDIQIALGQREEPPPPAPPPGQEPPPVPEGGLNSATTRLIPLFGLSDAASAADQAKWHYRIPGPRHLTVVLDTRTRRKFTGQFIAPPSLLGDSQGQQLPGGPFTDGREVLIVISPAPVLLPNILDGIGGPIYTTVSDFKYGFDYAQRKADDPCNPGGSVTGVEDADGEGWGANEAAREELLKQLATFKRVVILSGDVHYACSLVMDFWTPGVEKPARIVQLVSSPSRNRFMEVVEALLRSNALLQSYQRGIAPERVAWNGKSPLVVPEGTKLSPGRRARIRRKPSLLPALGWPDGVKLPDDPQQIPNWRWRVHLVRDVRPEGELPPAIQNSQIAPGLEGDLDPANAASHLATFRQIAKRHQSAAVQDHFYQLRQMVFTPNIGWVELSGSVDLEDKPLQVTHTLLSRRSAEDEIPGEKNTVHVISLVPTTDPEPKI